MKSLKELREHNNLKQREVAKHIGVSDRVYAYYEKGRTLPAKYVKPLANLFGISCDEFLENDVYLSDYTKQVRKEVCEEIRKFAYDTFKEFGCFDEVDLEHILDQIQGEKK
jgi:transcriptional regulator with XRE-family HTH domain